MRTIAKKSLEGVKNKMKEHIHSRIAKILVVLALAVVASVMFVFVGCNNECAHENTHNEVVAAATCTTEGITRTVCDDCGHVTESKTAALGHDWDEGTVVAATGTAGGYIVQTCSRCTVQRQVEPTEPIGHTWDAGKVVAATCTTGGYTLQTCTACGAQQQVNPTEPTGHNYAIDESKTVAGTCLTNGSVTYVCANCGDTYTEQTALGQHNYEKVTVASTCTTAGYTAERCTVCGNERNRENLPLAKHNFERDDEHSYAATCTVDGVEIEVCANCGITNTYTLKATGHKWGEAETVAPTCDKDGYSTHECTVCEAQETYDVKEATGHAWEKNVDGTDKLLKHEYCEVDGYYYKLCTKCGYEETSTRIPPQGHTFVYNAETTKITAPTCTVDGTMSGVCSRCGKDFSYTGSDLAKMSDAQFNALLIDVDVRNNPEYNLKNKDTAADAFTFLVAPGHDYKYDNEYPCVVAETLSDGTKVWNICDRCDEKFVAVDHTMPEGALPCVSIADNENYKGDTSKLTQEEKEKYAYVCTVCGQPQEVQEHDFAKYQLVSGNPFMGDPYKCEYELYEDQSIRVDCTVYLICNDCGHIEVGAPHTRPDADDLGYYNTCGHGHLCTVCKLELTMPLDHNLNGWSNASNPVVFDEENGLGYKAPTCTEVGYEYHFCTGCVARSYEDVEWVEGENYTVEEIEALNHYDWTAGHFKTIEVSRTGDDDVISCLTGTYYRDICNECGAVRISVKPTFYTRTESAGEAIYTELTEETFAKAKEDNNIYTAKSLDSKIEDVNLTKLSWTTDVYGRDWTDAVGNYGGREPGEHNWWILPLESYTKAQLAEYQAVNCVDDGWMILYCPKCGNPSLEVGAEGRVQTWAEFKHDPASDREYSLATYAWLSGYNQDNLEGITDQNGDGVVNVTDVMITDMKAKGTWHKGEMIPCGHDYCYDCVTGNHNPQYYLDVTFKNGVIAAQQIPYYSCRTDAENLARLEGILDELKASAAPDMYAFTYYSNSSFTAEIADLKAYFVGIAADGSQQYINKPLYIAAEKVDLDDKDNTIFNTSFNNKPAYWYGEEDKQVLDIEFYFNNNEIDYTTITSIRVEIKNTTGAVVAQADAEGEVLQNLWDASYEWGLGWDQNDDNVLDNPEKLWVSVGGFCSDNTAETNSDNTWIFSNMSIENGASLKDYTVTVTITTDAAATFVSTSTITG